MENVNLTLEDVSKPIPSKRVLVTQIRLSNLLEVNSVQATALVECSIRSYWPISKEIYESYEKKDAIKGDQWAHWQPEFVIHNKVEGDTDIAYYLKKKSALDLSAKFKLTSSNETPTEGYEVEQKISFTGSITNYADLRNFPFDQNVLTIHVRSETLDLPELQCVWDESLEPERIVGNATAAGCVDWEVGMPSYMIKESQRGNNKNRKVSEVVACVPIRRHASFFVWRILAVLFMVYAVSWSTFGMNPDDYGGRLGVNVTVLLALVTFLYVIAGYLPRVPYLTFIDKCTLLSFVFLLLTIVENYVVFKLQDDAALIDLASVIAFPVVFFLTIAYMLWNVLSNRVPFPKHVKKQEEIFEGRNKKLN